MTDAANRRPYNDLRDICCHCGRRAGKHGTVDNVHAPYRCPGDGRFPYPSRVGGMLTNTWNAVVDRYWTQRETTFEPTKGRDDQ